MTSSRILILLFALLLAGCAAKQGNHPAPVDVSAIALNPADGSQTEIGRLKFLGGLHLTSADARFGGHSGLFWRDGQLFTVIDEGRWSSFTPVEKHDRLIGVRDIEIGDLHGFAGEPLNSKALGDAESLTADANGDWLVGFERDHRVWRYPSLSAPAQPTTIEPDKLFAVLQPNNGVEAIAGSASGLVLCAERPADTQANCLRVNDEGVARFAMTPPSPLDRLGGAPTDAAIAADGDLYVLFRSFSLNDGSGAAIATRSPDGTVETIAVLRPPLSLDNMEGLALRQDDGRTFIYLISDNNFSPAQRTLLMKFEVIQK